MNNKRIVIALMSGAILGIFCISGVSVRFGFAGNEVFILATWVNRVVMGLVIGLAPYYQIKTTTKNIVLRGLFFGFVTSGSFYLATEFRDTPGFMAGLAYGVIIDFIATKFGQKKI